MSEKDYLIDFSDDFVRAIRIKAIEDYFECPIKDVECALKFHNDSNNKKIFPERQLPYTNQQYRKFQAHVTDASNEYIIHQLDETKRLVREQKDKIEQNQKIVDRVQEWYNQILDDLSMIVDQGGKDYEKLSIQNRLSYILSGKDKSKISRD